MNGSMSDEVAEIIRQARVGRLATINPEIIPHVVPVCYVLVEGKIYSAIDQKPKDSSPRELGRAKNIQSNPRATVLIDHYEENWDELYWVQLRGRASLLDANSQRHQMVIPLLRDKYSQYQDHDLSNRPLLELTPKNIVTWGDFGE